MVAISLFVKLMKMSANRTQYLKIVVAYGNVKNNNIMSMCVCCWFRAMAMVIFTYIMPCIVRGNIIHDTGGSEYIIGINLNTSGSINKFKFYYTAYVRSTEDVINSVLEKLRIPASMFLESEIFSCP